MEPSPELLAIINGWFGAVLGGDVSWVERHVSRQAGTRLIGTDPNEWIAGVQVGEFLATEARAMAGQITVTAGGSEAFQEGTVGWGVTNPTVTLPNGHSFSPRWSAVFHREEGEWKAVQIHASVGVPNEDLLGS